MNRKSKKRALHIRLTLVYSLMVLAVILLVAGFYLVIQGYRFNKFDRKIEQGGLVQFNSTPTGADVWLDQTRLANKTQSKLTVGAGSHTVSMQKTGYNTWKKDVTVRAGGILWLNYVRLVPQNLAVENVMPLKGVGSGKVSYDTKTYAVIEKESEPVITFVGLDTAEPTKRELTLPADSYTLPAEGEQQSFNLYTWAYDNRYILVKHTYGTHVEWVSFNTADGKTAKNLTRVLGIDAVDVQYAKDDANTLIMLTAASEVRKTNIDQKTVSGPLLTNVHDFTVYDTVTVAYTTNQDPITQKCTAGYLTIGAAAPRVVYQTAAGDSSPLAITINKYFGKVYQVVAHGQKLFVYSGDLSTSDAKDPVPFALLATLDLAGNAEKIGFSPDEHRFVYALSGNRVLTYDLDLSVDADISLQAVPQTGIDWIDEFHFVTVEDSTVHMYDYDGTNGHEMIKNTLAADVSLSQNGKYLTAVTKTGDTISISRVKMILD